MKPIPSILVTFTVLAGLCGCTAYVDPHVTVPVPTTTTTRTTTESPYLPGASLTTERTTTTY